MNTRSILVAAGVGVLLIGLAVWGTMWILSQPLETADEELAEPAPDGSIPSPSQEGAPEAGRIQVKLYVLGGSGLELAIQTEEIPYAPSLQQQAKEVIRLLLRTSAAIPRGVQLRELFITSQGVAYVDLSQEVVSNHPGGSSAEELTVFSLSQTLVANFPTIKTAKILVEGREIQTLAGHLDLTIPYGRAPDYLQPRSERGEKPNEAS